jgi:hypothetical protein
MHAGRYNEVVASKILGIVYVSLEQGNDGWHVKDC